VENTLKTLYPTYAQLTASGGYAISDLDPLVYSFYLNAYQKGSGYPSETTTDTAIADALSNHAYKALSASKTNVDTSTGNNTITFNLATVTSGNTGATGLAEITIVFNPTDDFGSVKYGFFTEAAPTAGYSVGSGETATNYFRTAYATRADNDTTTELVAAYGETTQKSVAFNQQVPAMQDQYFGAVFYNTQDVAIGAYFDRVTIDAGNETHGTVNVGDVLNTYAKNPTALSVSYSYLDDNDCTLTAANSVSTMVDATFTWSRACLNELGYLLCIYDLGTNPSAVTTEQPSSPTYAFNAKNEVVADTSTSRAAVGSLLAADLGPGGTSAKVRLQTGHLYTASIRAYNWTEKGSANDTAAISDDNEAVLADGPNADNAYEHPTFLGYTAAADTAAATDLSNMWSNKSETIFGMYTITYNLNKGYVVTQNGNTVKATLESDATTGAVTISNSNAYEQYYVRAYKYGTAATIMSDYNHEGYSVPYAKHDSYAFSKWVLPSTRKDGGTYTVTDTSYVLGTTAITGSSDDASAGFFPTATTISNFEYQAVWSVVVTVNNVTFPSYGSVPEVLIEGRDEGEIITAVVGDSVYVKALTITDATTAAAAETVTLTGYGQDGYTALSNTTTPALAPTTGFITWDTGGVAAGTYQIRATCPFKYTTNDGTVKTIQLQQTVYIKLNSASSTSD